jgi:multidrug efflux pump subunit AcrA (membrane-fusion protein)
MKNLGKIASILTILACLGSLYFTYNLSEKKKAQTAEIARLDGSLTATQAKLTTSEKNLKATKESLDQTQTKLAQSDASLQATKVTLDQKTQEAESLTKQVADAKQQLDQAKAEASSAQASLKKIQDGLAAAGIQDIGSMEQLREKILAQTEENKILGQQLLQMRDSVKTLSARIEDLTSMPVNLRGKIAAVQDRWGFVVLDLGRIDHVQSNSNFLVYRDTQLIGKVQVRTVLPTTSIAEINPDYQRGVPRIGDLVIH